MASVAVQATHEEVMGQAERYFRNDWPHGGEFKRETPHLMRVWTQRSGLPQSALGWFVGLTMTVITLVAWIPIWIIWILWNAGEEIDESTIAASPEKGLTRVDIDATNDEWRAALEGWLTRS